MHKPVYIELSDGARMPSKVAQLNRVLYRLKDSPLLWYREFTNTLKKFELQKSWEELCVFINNWLMMIFYVNDILLIYHKENEDKVNKFQKKLDSKYEIQDEEAIK